VISKRFTAFVLAAIFTSPFATSAKTGPPAADATATAKSLTRLLEDHYRHAQSLRAVFLERYSEGPRQARIESGTVYFKRPGRMRWEYESPEKKLFLVDGKTVWFYVPYDHTVTKAPAKESSDWRTPLALLTGKADLSRLCSRVDLIDERGTPNGHAVLRCVPKGSKPDASTSMNQSAEAGAELADAEDITDVLLEVDTSNGELARIEVRQPGGIQMEYRFGDWKTDIPLADDMFHFQVPNGVAIVDGSVTTTSPR
jgi:outer membrane lipoprotein carrier protein